MKNFLRNHGIWVLFAAAVIAVMLAVMSYLSNTSSPLVNAANVIASPFRSAYTAVATWFNDKQNYYRDTTQLQEENAELRRKIAEREPRSGRRRRPGGKPPAAGAAGSAGSSAGTSSLNPRSSRSTKSPTGPLP